MKWYAKSQSEEEDVKNTVDHIWQIPKNMKMDVMKRNLCRERNLIFDNIRFLLDGERINDEDTPASLGLSNGDNIEVFFEMKGGGPPEKLKQNLSGDENKILEILENTFDSDCSDISLDLEQTSKDDTLNSCKNYCKDKGFPAVQYNNEFKRSSETNPRRVQEILDLEKTTAYTNEEHARLNEDSVKDNQNIVQDLREKYENGTLLSKNALDKKIIHLLKQQTLAPVEIKMLAILKQRKELMETIKDEDKTLPSNKKKISRKRKIIPNEFKPRTRARVGDNGQERARAGNNDQEQARLGNNVQERDRAGNNGHERAREGNNGQERERAGNIVQGWARAGNNIQQKSEYEAEKSIDIDESDQFSNEQMEQIDCTPIKRRRLLSKFDVFSPSPFTKQSEVTADEMKMLSLAVHLFAQKKFGGNKILQKIRLEDEHFQEILKMAGPGSKYNLLEDRSAFQYKCLWRNTAKSKSDFCGDPETGFETDMKVHFPSKQTCPFQHCKSGIESPMSTVDIDLVLSSPKVGESSIKKASKCRKLFLQDETTDIRRKDILKDTMLYEKPSPTKEELKMQNKLLKAKIFNLEKKVDDTIESKTTVKDINTQILIPCKYENCGKVFTSTYGLYMHQKGKHGIEKFKNSQTCKYCGKDFLCIEKHIKTTHRDEAARFCAICQKPIFGNLKKHRSICKKCPNCDKIVDKKSRLLKHIANCKKRKIESFQMEPMDLSSPLKKAKTDGNLPFKMIAEESPTKNTFLDYARLSKSWKEGEGVGESGQICIRIKESGQELSRMVRSGQEWERSIRSGQEQERLLQTRQERETMVRSRQESEAMVKSGQEWETIGKNGQEQETMVKNGQEWETMIKNGQEKEKMVKSIQEWETIVRNGQGQETMDLSRREKETMGRNVQEQESMVMSRQEEETMVRNGETISWSEQHLESKRLKFPFDENNDEDYVSEFEDGDSEDYTTLRRRNKDNLELKLREIDDCTTRKYDGDEFVLEKFKAHMSNISKTEHTKGEFGKIQEPSTVLKYTRAIEKDLLPAFHALFEPFDSRWLLDCTTTKQCLINGEERQIIGPQEPIYITAGILRKAIEKYEQMENGNQRAIVLAAIVQFMNFIEVEFNNKMDTYGREPLEKVMIYHNGVRSYINGMKLWKTCNREKLKSQKNSRELKDYQNPNSDAKILESIKKYFKSDERLKNLKKIFFFAEEGSPIPSDKEFNDMGNIIMGEIILSTGCRPVVVYRLPLGSYVNKKPGFNPHNVTQGDSIVEEEENGQQIYRRLNPNLPPKKLACIHQLEKASAICEVNCSERCEPDGFNIFVDWDKTFETRGSSYLHLAKPIKDLMDLYDDVKSKKFARSKPQGTLKDDWLDDAKTPFFLKSSGTPFQTIDVKHISEKYDIDATAYSFRRIVSTWAQTHVSQEIRNMEEEALQHSSKVAKLHYNQSRQLIPQTLTQTYVEEEGLIPENVRKEIEKNEARIKSKICLTEKKRQSRQLTTLAEEKKIMRQIQEENHQLSSRRTVLEIDRKSFGDLIETVTGENIERNVKRRKPIEWRNFFVRTVCATEGESGDSLRTIWKKVYRGDLKWGVRDVRLKSQANNWPIRRKNKNQDRNSWIASSLLKSFQGAARKLD